MNADSLAQLINGPMADSTAFDFFHGYVPRFTVDVLPQIQSTAEADGALLSGLLLLIVVTGLLAVGTIAVIKWASK